MKLNRREFLKAGAGLGAAAAIPKALRAIENRQEKSVIKVIASANGLRATEKAASMLRMGADPLDAVISGVNIIENDPEDHSVGYGGLPNEEGIVELDASVMYGPTHNAGAVAALRNIKNPSMVARLVMERTAHALLVGEGALKFAKSHGFQEENILTEESRKIWLRRKEELSNQDFWYPPVSEKTPPEIKAFLLNHGTINCTALDSSANMASVTTTSGFFYKIPGRVGDSPIIGAGMYVDNEVGAAGSTGLGEANILNCGSNMVVEFMRSGSSPEEACLRALHRIAEKARLWPQWLNENGRPKFGLTFYALNKKGDCGAASMWQGAQYAVHDGTENRIRDAAFLFKKN